MAAIFEKNGLTLQKYGLQGCPCRVRDKDDRGRYNVTAIRRWLRAHDRLGKRPQNPGGRGAQAGLEDTKYSARLRKATAEQSEYKAEMGRLELERLRGELVPIAEVRELLVETMEFLVDALESEARSSGPALAGKTAVEVIAINRKRMRALLSEFAERRNVDNWRNR